MVTTESITGTSINTTDHGGERRPGVESEEADRRRDSELDEITRADQLRGPSNAVGDAEAVIEQVCERQIAVIRSTY